MALYGTTSEQLGFGGGQLPQARFDEPSAVMREPITIDDHQSSRPIVDPLHLLDCCLISDGAVAVIVTARRPGRDAAKPPV